MRYTTGAEIKDVSVGNHTLALTIEPGYKGTTSVSFDGKTVSTNIIVSTEMTSDVMDYVVLSVTGDISIDTPEPTPQEKEDNTIMMVLLVILVVLVAVMAGIIVIRLMRS